MNLSALYGRPKPSFLQRDDSRLWMFVRGDAFPVVIFLIAGTFGLILGSYWYFGLAGSVAPVSTLGVRAGVSGLIFSAGLCFRRVPGAHAIFPKGHPRYPDDYPWALAPRDDGRRNQRLAARFDLAAVWFFILAMLPALTSGVKLEEDYNVGLGLSIMASPFLLGFAWWRYARIKRIWTAYGPGLISFPAAPVRKGKTVNMVLTTKRPISDLKAVLWNVSEWIRGSGEDVETGRTIGERFPVEISGERNPDGTWTTVFTAETSPTTDPTALWAREPSYWQLRIEGGDAKAPYRAAFFVPVY